MQRLKLSIQNHQLATLEDIGEVIKVVLPCEDPFNEKGNLGHHVTTLNFPHPMEVSLLKCGVLVRIFTRT